MSAEIQAWHFASDKLRDGRPLPADGEWLIHEGEAVLCKTGLHASRRCIDALQYAPGNTICRVTCRKVIAEESNDKLVCLERRIDWRIDGEAVLREFARKAALSVIHLWDAPDIVRRYLETGDESIRDAARAAARDAASDAARAAARAAAWAAARAAARDAAWYAAWDAAWYAQLSEFNTILEQMLLAEHERMEGVRP